MVVISLACCICLYVGRGYKTFFVLNSAEHELCPVDKSQITNNWKFCFSKHSWAWNFPCYLLINTKMPTLVDIFIFINRENFILSWVEHENSFKTSRPVLFVWPFLSKNHHSFHWNIVYNLQPTLNSSNTDGSFTMANSNSFLSP